MLATAQCPAFTSQPTQGLAMQWQGLARMSITKLHHHSIPLPLLTYLQWR